MRHFTIFFLAIAALAVAVPSSAQNSTITSQVWDDQNANGSKQGFEPGIAAVQVDLLDGSGTLVTSLNTNGSGIVSFTGVNAGTYRLKFHLLSGHKFISKASSLTTDNNSDAKTGSGSLGETVNFSIGASDNINYVDAGVFSPGKLNTQVWDDQNANKTKQGFEPGIPGVTVKLLENDGSSPIPYPDWHPSFGTDVPDATTDATGKASFNYIPADRSVMLQYILKGGHKFTDKASSLITDDNSDAKTGSGSNFGKTDPFSIAKGNETINYVDAGMWAPGTLTTLVWDDQNPDKTKQGFEPGIQGVTVKLLENDGSSPIPYPDWHPSFGTNVPDGTTDANGMASFNYIPADRSVMLQYILKEGHKFTDKASSLTTDNNSDAKTGSGSNFGKTDPFSLANGSEPINYVDAGMWAPGTLNTLVWDDQNPNKTKQGFEPGIQGVTVELLKADGTTPVAYPSWHTKTGNVTALPTDATGKTSFDYIPADEPVMLKYNLKEGHKFTDKASTLTDDNNSDARTGSGSNFGKTFPFSMVKGSEPINYVDAGMWAPGTLNTLVWDDQNANKTKQGYEPGIKGVTVELLKADGTTPVSYPSWHTKTGNVTALPTDAAGKTSFDYIPADESVMLKYNLKPDHKFTDKASTLTDDNNSDARTGSGSNFGKTFTFSMVKGSEIINYVDAGMWAPGLVESQVWLDENSNGSKQGYEEELYGVEVKMLENNGVDPVKYPTGHSKAGQDVKGFTQCGNGLVTLYMPANRSVILQYIANGATFTTKASDILDDGKSDARTGSGSNFGKTFPFAVTKGSHKIKYVDAGFTDRGTMWTDASIKSFVWDDRNADGKQNGEGSYGIENVKVRLIDLSGNTCVCDKTDSNGEVTLPAVSYFTNYYKLKYDLPKDYKFTIKSGSLTQTKNSDAKSDGTTDKFSINAGKTIEYIDAGMWAPGTLETFVFDDRNNDGKHIGEGSHGIEGVDVQLVELSGNPVKYPNNTPVPIVTTNVNGKATIPYVPADRYVKLKYTLKDGHNYTKKVGAVTVDNNNDLKTDGKTDKFKMKKGSEVIKYVEAGMHAPGTLNTFVFDDINNDGKHIGEGSLGIAGVSVQLVEMDGTTPINYPSWHPTPGAPVPVQITDIKGKASFDYVPAGKYVKLKYTLKDGHNYTKKVGAVTVDNNNDLKTDGTTDKFKVVKGSEVIDYVEAGMHKPGTLETFVFDDINNDGNHIGEGSLGIAGVSVQLVEMDGTTPINYPSWHPTPGAPVPVQVTDANGKANFDYVPAGKYVKLRYTLKDGHNYTKKVGAITVDNNNDLKTDGTTDKFKVVKGSESIKYVEAGMHAPGTLETFVFDDINNDGKHIGEGSLGIAGVNVQLVEMDGTTPINYPSWHPTPGAPVPVQVTGANGKANFDYVPAGKYVKLKYTLPPDHNYTKKVGAVTVDNNNDLKTDGTTDKFKVVKGSESIKYVEAGMWTPGSIKTFVWEDVNADGNHVGEGGKGVQGVAVSLLDKAENQINYPIGHVNAGNPITAVTDNNGYATLDHVPADKYVKVKYAKPGIVFTIKSGPITADKNSDAKPSTGITDKFKVDRGNKMITYVKAGLTDVGGVGPLVLKSELTDFDIRIAEDGNQLLWETATEIQSDYFSIERSIDGNHFTSVGNVDAAGNSTMDIQYTFIDNQKYTGTIYYRLKMVDSDGSYEYSDIKSVDVINGIEYRVFPNPVSDVLNITFEDNYTFNGSYQITDMTGRILLTERITSPQVTIDVTQIPSGNYVVSLISNNTIVSTRVTITH